MNAATAPKCLVVMHHYVRPRDPLTEGGIIGPTPAEFAAHLDELTALLEPIDWPTLLAWQQGRGTIPRRSFLLTFDDGLADHAAFVRPLLNERGLRGTFFVSTEPLTCHRMLTAHAIHLLLGYVGAETLRIEIDSMLAAWSVPADFVLSFDTPEAIRVYHYETPARAELKYLLNMVLPSPLRRRIVDRLFEEHVGSHARWSREWYLGWNDLVAMQAEGHTIGGHGHTHEPLARVGLDVMRRDVQTCAAVISEGLGVDIRPFSYPFGSCDAAVCSACRDAGFAQGFTTVARWIETGCDPGNLPRVDAARVETELKGITPCTSTPHRQP